MSIIPRSGISSTLLIILLLTGIHSTAQERTPLTGEKVTFNLHYGFFKIGEAEIFIDPEVYELEGKQYYHIQCRFKTSDFITFFMKVSACYESYVNVNNYRPYVSNRDLKYGNSIDIRTDTFNYKDSVYVKAYVEDVDSHRNHAFFNEPRIYDFLSTYIFVRNQRLGLRKKLEIQTFYSNSVYKFLIESGEKTDYLWDDQYVSNEYIITFSENYLFKKEKAGSVLLATDPHNLPLQIDLDTSLGTLSFKLEKIESY